MNRLPIAHGIDTSAPRKSLLAGKLEVYLYAAADKLYYSSFQNFHARSQLEIGQLIDSQRIPPIRLILVRVDHVYRQHSLCECIHRYAHVPDT